MNHDLSYFNFLTNNYEVNISCYNNNYLTSLGCLYYLKYDDNKVYALIYL